MPPPNTTRDSYYKDTKPKPLGPIHTNHNTPSNNNIWKNLYRHTQDNILSANKSTAIGCHSMRYPTAITGNINTIHPELPYPPTTPTKEKSSSNNRS
eukprot:3359102-Ditylum_brightwellii.AAC.1